MVLEKLLQFVMQRTAAGQVFRQLIFGKPRHLAGFVANGRPAAQQFAQEKKFIDAKGIGWRVPLVVTVINRQQLCRFDLIAGFLPDFPCYILRGCRAGTHPHG